MRDGFVIDGAVLQKSNFEIAFAGFKSSQHIFILIDVLNQLLKEKRKKIDSK